MQPCDRWKHVNINWQLLEISALSRPTFKNRNRNCINSQAVRWRDARRQLCACLWTITSKQEAATLRVSAAGDADGFVVDLQADGTGELTLDALGRGSSRTWAAAGLLLLLTELGARWDKAPKHRHHGPGDDPQLSTATRCTREETSQLLSARLARASSVHRPECMTCNHSGVSIYLSYIYPR